MEESCPGLLSYLSYPAQEQMLRDSTVHSGLDPPTLARNQETTHRQAHRTIRGRQDLNRNSFSQGVLDLCPTDKK